MSLSRALLSNYLEIVRNIYGRQTSAGDSFPAVSGMPRERASFTFDIAQTERCYGIVVLVL